MPFCQVEAQIPQRKEIDSISCLRIVVTRKIVLSHHGSNVKSLHRALLFLPQISRDGHLDP